MDHDTPLLLELEQPEHSVDHPEAIEKLGNVASHDAMLAPLPDESVPVRERLPYLERRNFDPARACVELELFSRRKVYITPLDAFDIDVGTTKHPLPSESKMFSQRRQRTQTTHFSDGVKATFKADRDLQDKGVDIDGKMYVMIRSFLSTPRGKRILAGMGIEGTEVSDMSPKETIYLVGYLMNELTNYDYTSISSGNGMAEADGRSSLDIIANGVKAARKEDVPAMGVCRNFSDVAARIFVALKKFNPNLTNIYCHNAGGYVGATDGMFHKVGGQLKGHAWLDFIAIAQNGDMAITTVDPTWVKKSGREISQYDMTRLRSGTHLRNIAANETVNYSNLKQKNLESVRGFYTERISKMVEFLQKKYGNGQTIEISQIHPEDKAFQVAMYTAVDYVISASEFGGSAFYASKNSMPEAIRALIFGAATQEELIFSQSEYAAIVRVISMGIHNPNVSQKSKQRLQEVLSGLETRFNRYSQSSMYKLVFDLNEGDFNPHL